jgi:hypothetical protein
LGVGVGSSGLDLAQVHEAVRRGELLPYLLNKIRVGARVKGWG